MFLFSQPGVVSTSVIFLKTSRDTHVFWVVGGYAHHPVERHVDPASVDMVEETKRLLVAVSGAVWPML